MFWAFQLLAFILWASTSVQLVQLQIKDILKMYQLSQSKDSLHCNKHTQKKTQKFLTSEKSFSSAFCIADWAIQLRST